MNFEASIVIPTFNRAATLEKTLGALLSGNARDGLFEVIVVDDGSTDTTAGVVASFRELHPTPVIYTVQHHRGPAAARNKGIALAKGRIIIFLDDDIIVGSGFVQQHINGHAAYPGENIAIQGIIRWSRELKITAFMKFYERIISGYASYEDGREVESIITHNVSLVRSFLIQHGGFDETFPNAAYEDTDLTLRLRQFGFKVILFKKAVGEHYQTISVQEGLRRQERIGEAYRFLVKNHPDVQKIDLSDREFMRIQTEHVVLSLFYPLYVLLSAAGFSYPLNRYYKIKCYLSFLRGVRKGVSGSQRA